MGIDVNQTDSLKKTALHLAVEHDAFEACKLLFKKGINQDQRDSEGCFPAHYTLETENKRMLLFLMEKGYTPDFCAFELDIDFVHNCYDKFYYKHHKDERRRGWVFVGY